MADIKLGYGIGIKATLLTPAGAVCDLRDALYVNAVLKLPNGSTMYAQDIAVDRVTNAIYVRLLADRELTAVGNYRILFNIKLADGVMYSTVAVNFANVTTDADAEYKELSLSFSLEVTDYPQNVERTGASPKVSSLQTWLVYNDEAKAYEDTGIPAEISLDNYYTKGVVDEKDDEVKSMIMVYSSNLANTENYEAGRIIRQSGVIEDDPSYSISTFIKVSPYSYYIGNGLVALAWYDKDKSWIKRTYIKAGEAFLSPQNAEYCRISSNVPIDKWQLNEGDILLDYEPYYTPYEKIERIKEELKIDIENNTNRIEKIESGINQISSPYNKGELDIFKSQTSGWYRCLEGDFAEIFDRTSLFDYVISKFDEMLGGISDVTKVVIGTASGTNSDGNQYELVKYVLNPLQAKSPIGKDRVRPKFLLTGSVHGFEKNSTYGLFYFLKDLLYNWDKNDALRALRFGCELHIIPIANPYGFDNNTYTNGNGVNLNRNFPCAKWDEWVGEDAQYHGEYPLDQPESQAIAQLMYDNSDALAFLDCHTNGQYWTIGWNEATALVSSSDRHDEYFDRLIKNVLSRHIETQTAMWSRDYALNPTGPIGMYLLYETSEFSKGTLTCYATTSGQNLMLGVAVETFNGLKEYSGQPEEDAPIPLFSQTAKKICAENIGNMMLQIITEYGL